MDFMKIPHERTERIGHRMRMGLVALAVDQTVEPALRDMLPPDTTFYTSRVAMGTETTIENLASLECRLETAASLMPNDKLDVIAFACTSGAIAIGPEVVAAKISYGRTDARTTDPVSAALEAFRHLGIRSLALLTPYVDQVNEQIVTYIRKQGFAVSQAGAFSVKQRDISYISPRSIVEAATQMADSSADAVFISCTGLRSHIVIEEIERRTGKTVITSNQALAWCSLNFVGYDKSITGYGRLMLELGR